MLLHAGALPDPSAEGAEHRFARHGWPPAWRNGIYPWLHWHSRAHEALWVVRGRVSVQLGGDDGPVVALDAGDAVVLPAGTGHRNLGAAPDLLVVGAYPENGGAVDTGGARDDLAAAAARVAAVPDPPPCCPITGAPWPPA